MPATRLAPRASGTPTAGILLFFAASLRCFARPMLVHSVFFYLKPEVTEAQRAEFRRMLETLTAIKHADHIYIGTPAATAKRPTIDDSYAFGLTLVFKDVPAHDAYQVDPLHKAFVAQCSPLWQRVRIYDAA